MTFELRSLTAGNVDEETKLRPQIICGLVKRALTQIQVGHLHLTLPNGEVIERYGPRTGADANMILHHWRGIWRMLRDGEHGFSDGYLDGDWSTSDLGALLEFFMQNEAVVQESQGWWLTRLRHWISHRRRKNTKRGSRRNIAAHYDLGNDFYRLWLDQGMNYSSALYTKEQTLEAAQNAKLDRVGDLLELSGGESVLEIGCGWGALAERLVRRYGCRFAGITLSTEQLAFAKARLADIEEDARADLRLQDYRDVQGQYDRIASIEMLEAVGEKYWPAYFHKVKTALRDGGIAVIQAITIDESRYARYRSNPDFIQRYIFPGGMLPTSAEVKRQAEQAGLTLVNQEAFGQSYARTLREWREKFLQAWPNIEKLGFDLRFKRMWEYYLAYCEIGFRFGAIDVSLFKLAR